MKKIFFVYMPIRRWLLLISIFWPVIVAWFACKWTFKAVRWAVRYLYYGFRYHHLWHSENYYAQEQADREGVAA
jgi:hypothetical protein